MHSSVEEVDLDPCDLYIDLGTLIVEGRVPGLTERGFGEGPHCPPLQGQNRHQCNPGTLECQKYEHIQKHMLLLWKNGIPMSIEVLLYPSCCAGSTTIHSVDTASVPEMSYILLEQWMVHMLPRRVPDASINPRGLIQAVRSFLYFSQLCAWLSLTGGKSPQNIHYRICVPGEAFSSKFTVQPDVHIFPVSNIGRSTAMKVMVKSHPRCGQIPVVLCEKHTQLSQPVKTTKQVFRTEKLEDLPEESSPCDSGAEGEYVCDGVVPNALMTQQTSRTNSPADSMLGESLLDPPNSLCMYPKRYQSPSRCGSPSLEVPEHLMFGKGATVKREVEMQRLKQETRNRSRPQRRPVVERFLKKTLGNEMGASGSTEKCHSLDKRHSPLSDLLKPSVNDTAAVGHDGFVNYLCMSDDLKTLPKAEMEHVLHRLRNRCPRAKHTCDDSQCTYLLSNNEAVNCKLPKKSDLHNVSEYLQDLKVNVNKLPYKQKHLPQELCKPHKSTHSTSISESPLHLGNHSPTDKELVIKINQQSKPLGKNYHYPVKDIHDSQYSYDRTSEYFLKYHQMSDRTEHREFHDVQNAQTDHCIQRGQDNQEDFHVKKDALFPCAMQENHSDKLENDSCLAPDSNRTQHTYQECKAENSKNDTSTNSSGNNTKHYNLPHSRTWTEGLTEGQMMPNIFQGSTLLRYLFKPGYGGISSEGEVDLVNAGHIIPSAEEKAQFRRSLDSATSLVFHQKTGLPLTSSPAPIRKSGTCFDFDSSLTTVSAIKRALFEKEPEDGEWDQERTLHISTSAPASITVSSLLGTFEESVLNGRLEPVSTVEGFTAEIGASGSFCPRHITLPVTVFFYTLQDTDKVTSPYLGHINLGKREYYVPKKGTVQVTLFNPHNTVVKMYVVRYDLSDMPSNCQTFLRQRTLYMPTDASENDPEAQKWLRYLIHLRFASTKSGRIYLHTDVRVIVFRKSDLDAATVHGQRPYELRSFTHGPNNPKFSPHK